MSEMVRIGSSLVRNFLFFVKSSKFKIFFRIFLLLYDIYNQRQTKEMSKMDDFFRHIFQMSSLNRHLSMDPNKPFNDLPLLTPECNRCLIYWLPNIYVKIIEIIFQRNTNNAMISFI